MIRPCSVAVATVIHVLELSNLILVCIRELLHIIDSAIGKTIRVSGEPLGVHILCMGCRILPMNQGELEE